MSSSYAEERAVLYPPLDSELQNDSEASVPGSDMPREDKAEDVLAYYFKRIDPQVAASFSKEQRKALRSILARRRLARHAVEVRRILRLGRHRYYFLLLAGRERRAYEGMLPKGQTRRRAFHSGSLVVGLLAGIAVAAALKHLVGIDIIP